MWDYIDQVQFEGFRAEFWWSFLTYIKKNSVFVEVLLPLMFKERFVTTPKNSLNAT